MKFHVLFTALLPLVMMTSCTFNTAVDSLLSPPKLSEEQAEIYQALTDKIGNKVRLKYPKSGNYLSAFIVDSIDYEPTDEAIVFYERNGITADQISLRINILDKRSEQWSSVYDSPANGTEVEKVIISKLGSSPLMNIIVGYNMSQGEKNVSVYNYSEGILSQNYSDVYSSVDVCDIDNDTQEELIVITGNSTSETAVAKLLKLDESGKYSMYRTAMNENSLDYSQYLYSSNPDGTKTIVIDSIIGTNTIQTEILNPSAGDALEYSLSPEMLFQTIRSSSYSSSDIDNDGIIEIPTAGIFPGYENLPETEQLTIINWLVYEEGQLIRKYSGYYSINDGYAFMMPEEWYEKVTIKIDALSEEIVFYQYEESLENSNEELMRISVIKSVDDSGKIRDGYRFIRSRGETEYFVRINEKSSSELVPSLNEILCNFKFL